MRPKTRTFILLAFILAGCGTPKEFVMPFVNFKYSGERLFPASENDAAFTFRAWVSISTSIDRVFTISNDSDYGNAGRLLEIRGRSLDQKKKNLVKFKEFNITPKCGFKEFIAKVDSLNLLEIKNQPDSTFGQALHDPFSLFVIEIKEHGKFNSFRFFSHFPYKDTVAGRYQRVQDLIFKELPFTIYVNK